MERAYELKKEEFSVFFNQFAAKQWVISTLLIWISSVLPRAETVSLILQIRVLKISTARIDGWHSVPTFPKVNNLCISTYWIKIQCSCCCHRWTLNYRLKFPHSPILLWKKSVFPMAMYCFCRCFLYPRTKCIM